MARTCPLPETESAYDLLVMQLAEDARGYAEDAVERDCSPADNKIEALDGAISEAIFESGVFSGKRGVNSAAEVIQFSEHTPAEGDGDYSYTHSYTTGAEQNDHLRALAAGVLHKDIKDSIAANSI